MEADVSRVLSEAQHVEHIVEARRLLDRPARGSQGTPRKRITALGAVRNLDTLSHSAKDHRVVTDNVSCTNGLNADFSSLAFADQTLSRIDAGLIEIPIHGLC